jgi:hypothetical protein
VYILGLTLVAAPWWSLKGYIMFICKVVLRRIPTMWRPDLRYIPYSSLLGWINVCIFNLTTISLDDQCPPATGRLVMPLNTWYFKAIHARNIYEEFPVGSDHIGMACQNNAEHSNSFVSEWKSQEKSYIQPQRPIIHLRGNLRVAAQTNWLTPNILWTRSRDASIHLSGPHVGSICTITTTTTTSHFSVPLTPAHVPVQYMHLISHIQDKGFFW